MEAEPIKCRISKSRIADLSAKNVFSMKRTRFSHVALLGLVLLFSLCQVAGAMCPPPQGPVASTAIFASDDPMPCGMPDGSICQPQLTSSHGRHWVDDQVILHIDQQSPIAPLGLSVAPARSDHPVVTLSAILPSVVSQANSLQVLRI